MQATQAFKVGDKVRSSWPDLFGLVGEVLNTTAAVMPLVQFEQDIPDGHDGHPFAGINDGVKTRWYLLPQYLTRVEPAVGDRVRITSHGSSFDGKTGVVASYQWNDGLAVVIDGTYQSIWFGKSEVEVITTKQPSAADDLRLTPQAKTVLSHLKKRGRISPAEANTVYGISRLASCIHEIRNRAGYTVRTEQRRDDYGHKYAKYILAA